MSRVIVRSKRLPEKLVKETELTLRNYFPEIRRIYLYFTSSSYGRFLGGWKIALNPRILRRKREALHVIAHEVTHVIQWNQEVIRSLALKTKFRYLYDQRIPKGELACEIWTFARHEDLVSISPYIAKEVSRTKGFEDKAKEIHELSKEAIARRKNGERRYIKWFLSQLESIL